MHFFMEQWKQWNKKGKSRFTRKGVIFFTWKQRKQRKQRYIRYYILYFK
jgi:hypothetical protein